MSGNTTLDAGSARTLSGAVEADALPVKAQRIPVFDFTKGALVLFMVLYHWLNYFYGPEGAIYDYLRFLTPSFIFITGFLISYVHFAKYGDDPSKLSKRLFNRGAKLLAIFIAMNALVSILIPTSFIRSIVTNRAVTANLTAIFLVGSASGGEAGKIAAFGILVPISYLLILSSLLLLVRRFFRYVFPAAFAVALSSMVFLSLHDCQLPNLELIVVGLLGTVFGYVSVKQLQQLAGHPWIVVFVYCIYLVEISTRGVSYYTQMVGAFLTTVLIYVVGVHAGWKELSSRIVLLGKYSLFGYISQIAILQLLNASLRHMRLNLAVLAGSLVAGFALTMFVVEAMDWSRRRSRTVEQIYKWVFA